jgi:hypothetical protein
MVGGLAGGPDRRLRVHFYCKRWCETRLSEIQDWEFQQADATTLMALVFRM